MANGEVCFKKMELEARVKLGKHIDDSFNECYNCSGRLAEAYIRNCKDYNPLKELFDIKLNEV